MEKFTYRPQNVCPVAISFDLDGDTVHNISFSGGCSGNLKAISKLLEGKTVDEIAMIVQDRYDFPDKENQEIRAELNDFLSSMVRNEILYSNSSRLSQRNVNE